MKLDDEIVEVKEWDVVRVPPGTWRGYEGGLLGAGAVAVLAPRPAAGPALSFLKLFLGPPNATFSGGLLLGVLDPADELVASQRCDVLPGIECCGVGDQHLAQVRGQLMHHPAGHSLAAHRPMVVSGVKSVSLVARPSRRDALPTGGVIRGRNAVLEQ
jgi:hypothetical protein